MANCIIPSPSSRDAAFARLKREEMFWGDIYTGTVVDLVAAGILLASQVPGIPGNPKTMASYDESGQLTRKSKKKLSVTLTRRGHAEVRVILDEGEEKHRRQQRDDQRERERLAEVAKHRLERMPKTHADYKEGAAGYARTLLESILFHAGETPAHGFRYGDDEWEELLGHCKGILRVLAHGKTLFDASIQSAALVAEKSTIAQADGGFLRMLQSIVPPKADKKSAMKSATGDKQ